MKFLMDTSSYLNPSFLNVDDYKFTSLFILNIITHAQSSISQNFSSVFLFYIYIFLCHNFACKFMHAYVVNGSSHGQIHR